MEGTLNLAESIGGVSALKQTQISQSIKIELIILLERTYYLKLKTIAPLIRLLTFTDR